MMDCLQNIGFGSKAKVVPSGEKNIVITSKGDVLTLPGQLIGSTTKVKVLNDGTYKITSLPSVYGAKPVTTILTEDELIAKYGDKAGKKFQAVA